MVNTRALVGLFCGVAGVSACTSVRRVQPVTYLEDNAPPVVWVTYNNTIVPVAGAEIRRDTLRGTLQGARVKIPLAEIQSVEAKVRERRKTALLVSGLGVAAVATLYIGFISKAGSGGGPDVIYCPVDTRGRATNFC
mgnify:CR=1 FL=1